jgi:AraC family transcriptional regulator, ethanolamine operon transcriptional activator
MQFRQNQSAPGALQKESRMPAQNQIFQAYEASAAAIQNASLRATFLGKKYANWALSYLSVNNLGVQWGHTGGPGVVEGTVKVSKSAILMPTQNAHAISGNGRKLDDASLMIIRPGAEFCLSATNQNRWFIVFVPDELLSGPAGAFPTKIGSSCSLIRVPLNKADRFRSSVEKLGLIVQSRPEAFDSSAAITTTARKLAETVREVLTGEPYVTHPDKQVVPRREIIRKAMDFVDQHDYEYLVVEDLATAVGISERTLRRSFHEYFSVGPLRYLNLRTLHHVREALKAADPSMTSVTKIATQFGVWEFGRFARDYRFLFGELPSETLRHQ